MNQYILLKILFSRETVQQEKLFLSRDTTQQSWLKNAMLNLVISQWRLVRAAYFTMLWNVSLHPSKWMTAKCTAAFTPCSPISNAILSHANASFTTRTPWGHIAWIQQLPSKIATSSRTGCCPPLQCALFSRAQIQRIAPKRPDPLVL